MNQSICRCVHATLKTYINIDIFIFISLSREREKESRKTSEKHQYVRESKISNGSIPKQLHFQRYNVNYIFKGIMLAIIITIYCDIHKL